MLKKQAKALRRAHKQHDPNAAQRIKQIQTTLRDLPQEKLFERRFSIIDAQQIIAREYDFPSWAKLKHYVESISGIAPQILIRKFKAAIKNQDVDAIRALGKSYDLSEIINAPLFLYGDPVILAINMMSNNPIPMAQALLELGADINAKTVVPEKAYNILHYCLMRLDYNVPFEKETQFYLDHGITIDPWAACGLGYFDKLKSFIEDDPALINKKGPGGKTLLHHAREPAIIDYLLELGADIDARCTAHGSTPIQYSILKKEATLHFLERGATPDIFTTCQLNHLPTLEKLYAFDSDCFHEQIGKGHHQHATSKHGKFLSYLFPLHSYPIQLAYQHANKQTYSFILEHSTPKQAALYAAICGDKETATRLASQMNVEPAQFKNELNQILIQVCHSQNLNAVKILIGMGASINSSDETGNTPLHSACLENRDESIVKYLLELGANPNSELALRTKDIRRNHFEPHAELPEKLTPLGCVVNCMRSNFQNKKTVISIVKMLLDAGSEVDPALIDLAPKYLKKFLEAHLAN